jgi:hypothetical protein
VCLRNPADVGASLIARNAMSFERGVRLWVEYTKAAMDQTEDDRRLVLFYEDLMRDWPPVVEELGRFLDLPGAGAERTRRAVEAFLDPKLRHHATSPATVLADPRISPEARTLFDSLRKRFPR